MTAELDLLRRFHRDGDAAAMETLVARTRPRLMRVARRIASGGDVDDAVQGAYHALLRKGDLPDGANVRAWLITTTVRIAYRRKALAMRYTTAAERLALPARDDLPGRALDVRERDASVRRAVHSLPDRYRDAIVLHHLSEVPVSDVARLQQVPVSTVKTRLQRGRRLLRSRLSPALLHLGLLPIWGLADALRDVAALAAKGGLLVSGTGKVTTAGAALLFGLGLGVGTGAGVVGSEILRSDAPPTAAVAANSPTANGPTNALSPSRAADAGSALRVDAGAAARRRVDPAAAGSASSADDEGVVAAGGDVFAPPTAEVQARLGKALRELRRLALVHELTGVQGPSGATKPPDPERIERFTDERVWPDIHGWFERAPERYRVVGSDVSVHDGSADKTAYLFAKPLSAAVAAVTQQSFVFEKDVEPTGKVTLTSYGSVVCLGNMQGDVLTESYATVVVEGDMTGKVRSTSYAELLVAGKATGTIVTESYADIRVLGGFTGTMDLYDGAHVYLGGFVHSTDLARIKASGRADVLVERSDLGPGEHTIAGQSRLKITVQGY